MRRGISTDFMKFGKVKLKTDEKWGAWTLAIYALLLFLRFFNEGADFSLSEFSNFYISQATLDGISVGKRVSLFYQACLISLFFLPPFYYLASFYLTRFNRSQEVITVLSITGILMLLCDVMLYDSDKSIKTISILILLTGLIHAIKRLKVIQAAWPVLISVAFITCFTVSGMFNSNRFITAQSETWFLIFLFVGGVIVFIASRIWRSSLRRFFAFLLPVYLSPLLLFVAIEGRFLLENENTWYNFKLVFLILFFFSVIGGFLFARQSHHSATALAERFIAPSVLLSFIIFTGYTPFFEQPSDFFELGNIANAQMLVYEFGKIPMVDFFTSHMFSEQFYGLIYHSIFGYERSLNFLAYSFLQGLITYFLIYHFTKRLFGHWALALLFTLSMPYLTLLFGISLFNSVLAFSVCLIVQRKPSVKSHILLIGTLVALIVWRLDTGVAALTATAIFLPILHFSEKSVPNVKIWAKAVSICVFSLGVLLILAIALRSPQYIANNFLTALHYVAGNQAHGFSQVASDYNHHLRIIIYLLPISAIVLLFTAISQLRSSAISHPNFSLKGSIFFFLIFLSNFPRGLVRHGFLESRDYHYTSTFFLALGLFVFYHLKNHKPAVRYSGFCLALLLSYVSVKYFPLPEGKAPIEKYFVQPKLVNLDDDLEKFGSDRVRGSELFANENFAELKAFLDENLTDNQTFLDFSNSPMLYFYTGREVPAYFAQSLQNSIDDFTQLNHLQRVDTNRVPVVIYSHDPPNWFDATDGVQNSMRYYLIADFIYRFYRPFKSINGLQVWILKSDMENYAPAENDHLYKPEYDYGYAPQAMFEYFENKPELIELKSEIQVSNQSVIVPQMLRGQEHLFLSLKLNKAESSGNIIIYQFLKDRYSARFDLKTTPDQTEYMVPLSNTLSWHELSPDVIYFESSEGVKIEKVKFYKDLRREN